MTEDAPSPLPDEPPQSEPPPTPPEEPPSSEARPTPEAPPPARAPKPAPGPPRPLSRRTAIWLSIVSVAVLLGLWEAVPRIVVASGARSGFPPLSEVAQAFGALCADGSLLWDALRSTWRVVVGLLIAALVGIPCGIALGVSTAVRAIAAPVMAILRPQLSIAWVFALTVAVSALLFGRGPGAVFAVAIVVALVPTLVATFDAVSRVDPEPIRAARGRGAGWGPVALRVILPAAGPGIVRGLRVTLAVAWLCVIGTEMLLGQDGFGAVLQLVRSWDSLPQVVAYVAALAVTVLLLHQLFERINTAAVRATALAEETGKGEAEAAASAAAERLAGAIGAAHEAEEQVAGRRRELVAAAEEAAQQVRLDAERARKAAREQLQAEESGLSERLAEKLEAALNERLPSERLDALLTRDELPDAVTPAQLTKALEAAFHERLPMDRIAKLVTRTELPDSVTPAQLAKALEAAFQERLPLDRIAALVTGEELQQAVAKAQPKKRKADAGVTPEQLAKTLDTVLRERLPLDRIAALVTRDEVEKAVADAVAKAPGKKGTTGKGVTPEQLATTLDELLPERLPLERIADLVTHDELKDMVADSATGPAGTVKMSERAIADAVLLNDAVKEFFEERLRHVIEYIKDDLVPSAIRKQMKQ